MMVGHPASSAGYDQQKTFDQMPPMWQIAVTQLGTANSQKVPEGATRPTRKRTFYYSAARLNSQMV